MSTARLGTGDRHQSANLLAMYPLKTALNTATTSATTFIVCLALEADICLSGAVHGSANTRVSGIAARSPAPGHLARVPGMVSENLGVEIRRGLKQLSKYFILGRKYIDCTSQSKIK